MCYNYRTSQHELPHMLSGTPNVLVCRTRKPTKWQLLSSTAETLLLSSTFSSSAETNREAASETFVERGSVIVAASDYLVPISSRHITNTKATTTRSYDTALSISATHDYEDIVEPEGENRVYTDPIKLKRNEAYRACSVQDKLIDNHLQHHILKCTQWVYSHKHKRICTNVSSAWCNVHALVLHGSFVHHMKILRSQYLCIISVTYVNCAHGPYMYATSHSVVSHKLLTMIRTI